MKKQRSKEEKGITLVALVVTIIVLIILAGVTLNIVLDNDGIINKAKQAVGDYENSQREEQEMLGEIEGYIEYAGKTAPIPEGYTKSQITTEDDIAEGLVIYEIPEGATVNWKEDEADGTNQSTITIGGSTTNLQETVNQYVWIPVEDINDMVMCKSNNKLPEGEENKICNLAYNGETDELACTNPEHSTTATDLVGRLYASKYIYTEEGENTIVSYTMDFTKRDQTYTAGSRYHEPNTVSDDADNDLTIDQLKSDFIAMAKSVAKNGGFYISRYEVGANGDSKKNQKVLTSASSDGSNYLGADMWYGLYNSIRKIDKNKQMIWGCQYDQVIKFLKENGEDPENGHSDRNLTIDHALSGQNEQACMKNIYDLEGNHWECTAEASYIDTRTYRGGYYGAASYGSFSPASARSSGRGPTYSHYGYSSRTTLYL